MAKRIRCLANTSRTQMAARWAQVDIIWLSLIVVVAVVGRGFGPLVALSGERLVCLQKAR